MTYTYNLFILLFKTIPYFLLEVFEQGFDIIDTILTNKLGGTAVVALTTIIVVKWCMNVPRESLVSGYQTILSREVDKTGNNPNVNKLNMSLLLLLSLFCFLIITFLFFFSDWICDIFLLRGDTRIFVLEVLNILIFMLPMSYINKWLRLYLLISRKQIIAALGSALCITVNISGDLLSLRYNWGMKGIYTATLLSYTVQNIFWFIVIQYYYRFKLTTPSKEYIIQIINISKYLFIREIVQRSWNVISARVAAMCSETFYNIYMVMLNVYLCQQSIIVSGNQSILTYFKILIY